MRNVLVRASSSMTAAASARSESSSASAGSNCSATLVATQKARRLSSHVFHTCSSKKLANSVLLPPLVARSDFASAATPMGHPSVASNRAPASTGARSRPSAWK